MYSPTSREAVTDLYAGRPVLNYATFDEDNAAAAARLVQLGLDPLHPRPDGKWTTVRTQTIKATRKKSELARKLFQWCVPLRLLGALYAHPR